MKSFDQLKRRFIDPKPLADEDWKEFFAQTADLPGDPATILLQARSGWEMVLAVRRFERSTTKLTYWLIGLTAALVVLTGILTYFTIVLVKKC